MIKINQQWFGLRLSVYLQFLYSVLGTSLLWRSTVAFIYLKVKSGGLGLGRSVRGLGIKNGFVYITHFSIEHRSVGGCWKCGDLVCEEFSWTISVAVKRGKSVIPCSWDTTANNSLERLCIPGLIETTSLSGSARFYFRIHFYFRFRF